MPTVLLVDDEDLTLDAYRAALAQAPHLEVVGTARNGLQAVAAYRELQPDVVVMDLHMRGISGADATAEIVEEWPGATVLVVTSFGALEWVVPALRAGAAGYLLKTHTPEAIVRGIEQAVEGEFPLDPSVARLLADRAVATTVQPVRLTPREVDVLACLGEGLRNEDITQQLRMSVSTVKGHVAALMDKLDATNRVQVVVRAYQCGLLPVRRP